jgi:hypothetical protein
MISDASAEASNSRRRSTRFQAKSMTQRWVVALVAGRTAVTIAALFQTWRRAVHVPGKVDKFCNDLRTHSSALPVLYYSEWIDRWLGSDAFPEPQIVSGRRFEACCLPAVRVREWSKQVDRQFPEQEWFANRIREASRAWQPSMSESVVLIVREVLGGSATDEEIAQSFLSIPEWLASPIESSDEIVSQ